MNSTQSDSFAVEVIGFSEAEKLLLSSAFGLFSRRTPRFFQQEAAAGLPKVFLVDANDAGVMERFNARNPLSKIPAIFVGDENCATDWPVLVRPIRWLKLLQALESAMSLPIAEARPKAVVDFDVTSPGMLATPVPAAAPAPAVATKAPEIARPAPAMPELFVNKTQPAKPAPSVPPVVNSNAESVLVVDDNVTVREFMKNKLAPFNFNVDYAESGEQAIGLTGQKHYACIFLDVIMPGIDGYQVCKLIKSKRTAPKTTVIMLTSKDSPFDKIRGSMSGCDAYLTKPVDEERLLETIVKYLPIRK